MGALFYVYEMILRASTGVMGHDIRLSFGLSGQALGWLSAMYYWAYTPLQIPCGLLLDRIGARLVLTVSCLLCAVSAGIMAGTDSTTIAAIARWGMGAGSACAFISCLALIHRWFAPGLFALMMGVTNSLGSVGGILAGKPLAWLMRYGGWRGALMTLCWIGVGLTVLIWMILPSVDTVATDSVKHEDSSPPSPEITATPQHQMVSDSQARHQEPPAQTSSLASTMTGMATVLVSLVKQPQMWLLGIIGGVLYLPFSAFAELWAIPFIQTTYGVKASEASVASMLLYAMNSISCPLWAALAIHWKSYKRVLAYSSIADSLIFGLMACACWLPFQAIVVASAALGLVMGGQVLVFSLAKEHTKPEHLGTTHAFINALIMGCGLVFQPLMGKVLDLSWSLCQGERLPNGALVYTPSMYILAIVTVSVACLGAWLMVKRLVDLFPGKPPCQTRTLYLITHRQGYLWHDHTPAFWTRARWYLRSLLAHDLRLESSLQSQASG